MLGRARGQFGRDRPPPFGVSRRENPRNTVVVPSMNERYPKHPTVVHLVKRSWDNDTDFLTLDLNGHRHIVSLRSGLRYHAWIDQDTFADEAIALSSTNYAAPKSVLDTDNDGSPTSGEDEIPLDVLRSGRPITPRDNATGQHGGISKTAQHDREVRPKNVLKKRLRLKKGLRPNFRTSPTRSVALEKAEIPEMSILPSRPGPQPESNPTTVPRPAHQPSPTLSAPLLSSCATTHLHSTYKRRNTRMVIDVDISGKVHNKGSIRLHSCTNIETFLKAVCQRSNVAEASIATLTVRFPWLEGIPQRQEIRLDRNVGLMQTLFDEVENAPCWQEAGDPCCNLMATVLQKPGWDEDHHQTMLSLGSQP